MRTTGRRRRPVAEIEVLESRCLMANELLAWGAGLIVGDFGGSRGGIFVARSDGSDMRQITVSQTNNYEFSGDGINLPDDHPSFSPDGKKIAFTTSRFQTAGETNNFEIAIMNVDGTNIRRLTDSPGIDTEPVFSPDGTRIAFVSQRAGNLDVWIMNADGTNLVRLTDAPEAENEPAWSHSGTQIAYTKILDGGVFGLFGAEKDVYVMNADGTNRRLVAGLQAEEHDAVWTLDDKKLLITSEKDDTLPFGDVCTIDVATGAYLNNLTIDDRTLFIGGGGDPTLSPDGTKIAYFKATGGPLLLAGPQTVFVMNANGGGKTKINAPGIINVHPHFGRIADGDQDGVPDYMDAQTPASFTQAMIRDEAAVRNYLGDLTKIETQVGIGRLAAKGYVPTHNFNSFQGMGVAFARDLNLNDPSQLGRPDVLLYAPDLTPGVIFTPDPTDAFADFPYRLIGWGYATSYDPAQVPRFGGFPADAWLVHEAGFHHLAGGTFEPTPPSGDVPKGSRPMNIRPSGNFGAPWHERLWDIHFFSNPNGGAPIAAIHDPFGRNLPGFASGTNSFFYPQVPFNGEPIPGRRVEAEDFDMGEGFGWGDNTAANTGGKYRVTGVDVADSEDSNGGFDVVGMSVGEFLRYTVDFPSTGTYDFAFRFSNGRSGGRFHVEVDGVNRSGPVDFPVTTSGAGRLNPGRPSYETFTPFSTSFTAGRHAVKIVFDASPSGLGSEPRLNAFSFTRSAAPTAALARIGTVTTMSDSTLITVTYGDNAAINVATIDGLDVRVTGPNGFDQPATLVGRSESNNSPEVVATYKLPARGTLWDPSDAGTYTVFLQGSQVADLQGNVVAGRTLGTFDVAVPSVVLVRDFPLATFTMVVNGTDAADTITMTRAGGVLQTFLGKTSLGTVAESTVSQIVVNAGGGADTINLAPVATRATINGGDGDDTMSGGAAADTLRGEGGADVAVNAHIGPDVVDLGPETSPAQGVRFLGTARADFIVVKREVVNGQTFIIFDTSFGRFRFAVTGCRTVTVDGGAGDDVIALDASAARFWHARFLGRQGNDVLRGGALADILRGAQGNDILIGGGGRDFLIGGPGHDTLIPGRPASPGRGRGIAPRREALRPTTTVDGLTPNPFVKRRRSTERGG